MAAFVVEIQDPVFRISDQFSSVHFVRMYPVLPQHRLRISIYIYYMMWTLASHLTIYFLLSIIGLMSGVFFYSEKYTLASEFHTQHSSLYIYSSLKIFFSNFLCNKYTCVLCLFAFILRNFKIQITPHSSRWTDVLWVMQMADKKIQNAIRCE